MSLLLARRITRRARAVAEKALLAPRIAAKWHRDRRHLPLAHEQWELYEIIHRFGWRELGRFPNLIDCRDFNDRMQWLKLFDQREETIRCSDKVLVRNYIRERIGEKYLVKLYQVQNHFSAIDFDALPSAFVIKANHDSGTVILVRDRSDLDFNAAERRIDAALRRPYGWHKGEWAYSYIEPRVLIEELLEPHNEKPPPDYKFYCVNGVVKFCHYIYDRGFDTKAQTIDPCGNDLAIELSTSLKLGRDFRKPPLWDEMLLVAHALSKGFKCVRVDLFCTNDRVYAGELTFWPRAGLYKGEGQEKLSLLLDFDRTTYKPFLLNQLTKPQWRSNKPPAIGKAQSTNL